MRRASFFASIAAVALVLAGTTPAEPTAGWAGTYTQYAVAADTPVASDAGAEILAAGGNAADAAAATMLALGVASPASSGLGGGGFALYYRASDRTLTFLDFREEAPSAATAEMFANAEERAGEGPLAQPSQIGGLSSGVPGEAAGIDELVRRFGSLPLSRIVEPAARLAERGFEVSAPLAEVSIPFAAQMKRDATLRRWFPGGAEGLPIGHVLRQPELGRTLRLFGRSGRDAFYRGPIARAIVQANRRAGGIMTMADLAAYRVVERAPLEATHFGHRWVTAPPPSAGGFTMLQSLALLERWVPADALRRDARFLHALAESWKGPYLDRARYFGDPDHVQLALDRLGATRRVAARAAAFHPALAMPTNDFEQPIGTAARVAQPEGGGTSHLCVVDREGNVASITTTINLPFGARYTAAGIVMNDEMDDFAREVGAPNAFGLPGGAPNLPGPGRRPVSTMTPTIVLGAGGDPVLCVGAAGGSRIVTATQQVALNALVLGLDPAAAMDAPRIHHQGMPNALYTEDTHPLDGDSVNRLRARGHALDRMEHIATVQAIRIEREDDARRLVAVSDPRKGGRPAGQ